MEKENTNHQHRRRSLEGKLVSRRQLRALVHFIKERTVTCFPAALLRIEMISVFIAQTLDLSTWGEKDF
jgi:hypothetical protein